MLDGWLGSAAAGRAARRTSGALPARGPLPDRARRRHRAARARSTCSRAGGGRSPADRPRLQDRCACGGGAPRASTPPTRCSATSTRRRSRRRRARTRVRSAYVFLERPDAPLIVGARRRGDRRRPRRGSRRWSPRSARRASSRRPSRTRASATTARPGARLCPHPPELTMRPAAERAAGARAASPSSPTDRWSRRRAPRRRSAAGRVAPRPASLRGWRRALHPATRQPRAARRRSRAWTTAASPTGCSASTSSRRAREIGSTAP